MVTVLRISWTGAATTSGVPQIAAQAEPGGFSSPQLGQRITRLRRPRGGPGRGAGLRSDLAPRVAGRHAELDQHVALRSNHLRMHARVARLDRSGLRQNGSNPASPAAMRLAELVGEVGVR